MQGMYQHHKSPSKEVSESENEDSIESNNFVETEFYL